MVLRFYGLGISLYHVNLGAKWLHYLRWTKTSGKFHWEVWLAMHYCEKSGEIKLLVYRYFWTKVHMSYRYNINRLIITFKIIIALSIRMISF